MDTSYDDDTRERVIDLTHGDQMCFNLWLAVEARQRGVATGLTRAPNPQCLDAEEPSPMNHQGHCP